MGDHHGFSAGKDRTFVVAADLCVYLFAAGVVLGLAWFLFWLLSA